jgi:hypothetical protein
MKLEELLMQTIPTLPGSSSASIEEFASFPSHPERLTEKNCLGQSKGSWKVMGAIKKAFVMTGTGGSVKDAEDVLLFQEVLTLVINEWGQETGIFIPFLKYGEPGNLAVC